ncbi:serine/threonine protein kinase [Thermincola ferriacetica]|uniref:non-specific serine/threonine protein kinase n=1 Tax=Thermincola ferriacetica TaxID=281456 RepID=A0A0L6W2K3_9FIRM|nr:protein kinase [Thermincola ferriacetica]KNZ69696.1 serine/threonine protein kinase [Thermincola ferriacetica]
MARVLKNVSKISGIYGQPGEEKVSSLLEKSLPEDYVVLNSPRIFYHGATIDIDHVVIGPNGVFVIESKNMHGKISGGLMGNWTQERKRSGKNKKVKIGNPANQVNHYAKIVKSYTTVRYLNEYGDKVSVKVYPIVVFVHEEADLSTMEFTRPGYVGRVKVLKLDELVDYIHTREGASYSREDIAHFAEILVPAEHRDQTEYFAPGFLTEQLGQNVHRYEIYEEIGRGNFGTVFRGFDIKLDREVAIKKMHSKQKDPEAVRRFFREAQINAKLNHENIVAVYDYYEDNGDYYLIMEYIDGITLEEYLHDKKPGWQETYNIIEPVCAALEHAHANHVVHRDLKPANILLTGDMKVKVSDFGIARLTEDSSLTQTLAGIGTPSVMAPEQITGKKVDEKTDIFGLGVLMYLLLTGDYPFTGGHIGELVNKVLYQEPAPIKEKNPQVPSMVADVVMKCLAKEPEQRFQSVTELREALYYVFVKEQPYLKGTGQLSGGRYRRWVQKLPAPLRGLMASERKFLTTVTLVTLVIIIFLVSYQAYSDSRKATGDFLQTAQYGFTNENLRTLYSDPAKFKGVPVNLVGKIEKILQLTDTTTIFTITVEGDNVPFKNLIVEYRKPHFMLQYSEYIKVVGSVQIKNGIKGSKGSTPIIVADKIEPVEDPWSVLAPTVLTVYPNKAVNMDGEVVNINRVEFATKETRLFITVANYSRHKAYFVLSKPIGRQGNRVFREIPNRYGIFSQPTLELMPGEYIDEVVFLEPMDPKEKSARFIFGSDLNIADTEKPYILDISW